jgi:uncharacterized protein (DUF1697 family)
MKQYIAFLKGINLGKRRLPMSQLKALFQEMGFAEVETFIASGNVLFSTAPTDGRKLESRIARHLAAALGYEVDTFVRTADEVAEIGRAKLFPEDGKENITIHVGFLQQELPKEIVKRLTAITTDHDEFRVVGREYYWLCRIRTNESEVWKLPAIKALKLPTATLRNRSSIRKLIAKHLE